MTITIPKPLLVALVVALALLVGAGGGYAAARETVVHPTTTQHLYIDWSKYADQAQVFHLTVDGNLYRCSVITHFSYGSLAETCDWDHPLER